MGIMEKQTGIVLAFALIAAGQWVGVQVGGLPAPQPR